MAMDLDALEREMTIWRGGLHAKPEFGFEEKRTSAFIAAKLREFGHDEVVEGVGGTGVVGTTPKRGSGNRAITLRADMDALRITELGTQDYRSQNPGTMHACSHDGHTAMLLGAAKLFAEEGEFDGTVRFVFQPAEEWGKGALAMSANGLMERFPFEEIYGLHNMPGLPAEHFQTRVGPIMLAEDSFEIVLSGVGGHAARPHWSSEVLVAACATVMNLQTIVSRRLSPTDIGVVSVTELVTDGTRNALPGHARILSDARSFLPEVSAEIECQMRIIAEGTALTYNVAAEVTYTREFVPLAAAERCRSCGRGFRGGPNGIRTRLRREPMTGSEEFAQFPKRVPGRFVFVGNGKDSAPLHNPSYDFNDEGLLYGAGFHPPSSDSVCHRPNRHRPSIPERRRSPTWGHARTFISFSEDLLTLASLTSTFPKEIETSLSLLSNQSLFARSTG